MDPEELGSLTVKYNKTVYQIEKGLPPNGVVPLLKERVENMRDKVSYVRNLICLSNSWHYHLYRDEKKEMLFFNWG